VKFREERGAEQFSGGVIVAFAQGTSHFERGLAIAAPGRFTHGQQGIGNLRHRADHDHRPIRQPPLDDLRHAVNRFRVLHGSPAELHHNHGVCPVLVFPVFPCAPCGRICSLCSAESCVTRGIPSP